MKDVINSNDQCNDDTTLTIHDGNRRDVAAILLQEGQAHITTHKIPDQEWLHKFNDSVGKFVDYSVFSESVESRKALRGMISLQILQQQLGDVLKKELQKYRYEVEKLCQKQDIHPQTVIKIYTSPEGRITFLYKDGTDVYLYWECENTDSHLHGYVDNCVIVKYNSEDHRKVWGQSTMFRISSLAPTDDTQSQKNLINKPILVK